jgi:hypothetical protein
MDRPADLPVGPLPEGIGLSPMYVLGVGSPRQPGVVGAPEEDGIRSCLDRRCAEAQSLRTTQEKRKEEVGW